MPPCNAVEIFGDNGNLIRKRLRSPSAIAKSGDRLPKNIQEHNFHLAPIYCFLTRMASPIPAKKLGLKGKVKPDVRSLKRKRVTEDYEKLQRNVQELVSDCLRLQFYIVTNAGKGPEDSRH